MRNLRPEESCQLLKTLGVPPPLQEVVLDIAYSQPLALVFLADWLALDATKAEAISLEHAPDVIRLMVERFLQDVPTARHCHVLEACALTRATTRSTAGRCAGRGSRARPLRLAAPSVLH